MALEDGTIVEERLLIITTFSFHSSRFKSGLIPKPPNFEQGSDKPRKPDYAAVGTGAKGEEARV